MDRTSGTKQSTTSKLAITQSQPLSNEDLVRKLLSLMAQAQAFFPNQTLPPGTPDLWLRAWEEMAGEMGVQRFERALWRALVTGSFIPNPDDIRRNDDELQKIEAAKRSANADERRRQELLNSEKHRKTHPEEYFRIEELVKPLLAKFGASRTEAK